LILVAAGSDSFPVEFCFYVRREIEVDRAVKPSYGQFPSRSDCETSFRSTDRVPLPDVATVEHAVRDSALATPSTLQPANRNAYDWFLKSRRSSTTIACSQVDVTVSPPFWTVTFQAQASNARGPDPVCAHRKSSASDCPLTRTPRLNLFTASRKNEMGACANFRSAPIRQRGNTWPSVRLPGQPECRPRCMP